MPRKKSKKTVKAAKKATKTTKGGKKKKLDSLEQTHGKEEFRPTTLDQIWGDTGLWKYNTSDAKEYSQQLNDMTLSDVQEHATKIGLIPRGSRVLLQKKLVSEFNKFVSQYRFKPATPKKAPPLPEEIKKILKEGQ